MANSPPDTKNAAPAASHNEDYKKLNCMPPAQRTHSASLLTQALRSADATSSNIASTFSSSPASESETGDMPPVTVVHSNFDLRSSPFEFREIINNGSRQIRGTSLERTVKEKRVQERPKGTYSTNPGDTALQPTFGQTPLEHITNKTPTEGPRAKYRHWRVDSRTNPPTAGKAWSIDVEDNDGGQVEKAIRAVLSGDRPNNRSRKASQALGFFRESLQKDEKAPEEPQSRKTLPKALLADIRKLKPASTRPKRTATFSVRPADAKNLDASAEDSRPDKGEDSSDAHRVENDDEDAGEDEERQIFFKSAVFVPHQPYNDPARDGKNDTPSNKQLKDGAVSDSHQWLEEYEVSAHENGQHMAEEAANDGILATDDQVRGKPAAQKENRLDGTDIADNERTSTGSLTEEDEFSDRYENAVPEEVPEKMPPDAVELVPYRHQVGGHTKLWRFSSKAVCKKLDKRENNFYENIEQYHPEFLEFLPKYIGVINVFYKTLTKSKLPRTATATDGGTLTQTTPTTISERNENQQQHTRVVSQSLEGAPEEIPTVTFQDNRHLLPHLFLQDHTPPRATLAPCAPDTAKRQSMPPPPHSDFRPTLSDKHAASWGTSIANSELASKAWFELHNQKPQVQPHQRPGYHKRSLPIRNRMSSLRTSISESSLRVPQQNQAPKNEPPEQTSIRRQAMVANAEQRFSPPPAAAPETAFLSPEPQGDRNGDLASANEDNTSFSERAGTSAPDHETPHSRTASRQRRYSSGGLRRKPTEVADARGDLKYFEEADDAGYKGDNEGDQNVFNMDPDIIPQEKSAAAAPDQVPVAGTEPEQCQKSSNDKTTDMAADDLSVPRPKNPKEARSDQWSEHLHYFIVMEDLTCGMKRPCMMDLKIGTRQYSTAADEKKQLSQRRKSAKSTSQKLGVRICGMQVWDVKKQENIFYDKYRGRDLKIGDEFKDALKLFLYDGIDNSSILRHIPPILEKLSRLEECVRGLGGYRFYGTSLLMGYDGDPQASWESDSNISERDSSGYIDFRIADFANGVIGDERKPVVKLKCPPQHPKLPDNGFLRGLRSLRKYFLKIQREVHAEQIGRDVEKEDQHGSTEEDEGTVSY
ncbi:inositol polyphosphate kinase [Calycina marina]|uniref:Kinase n=1 Tax=Calycina marina TaxID=1763456 RepID=A0A9P8CDP6_9HELO|nr:inositol polyphosphate kinase [Calycina marina]